MQKITTFLMFDKDGKQAVDLYTSVFKDSKVNSMMVHPETGALLYASFTLNGHDFYAMDGGDHFRFDEGMSLYVDCADQTEVDDYWNALTRDGGQEGQCGWLKDKFGVSWQIIPSAFGKYMNDPDPSKSGRVMQAMLKMNKMIVADLEKAYKGE